MLIDLIQDYINGRGTLPELLLSTVFIAIIVMISLSVHEMAHGYIAYKMGDPTARNMGRLTLNPAAHLDPIGTLCMLLFGFGWAKPVPVNARYFKKPRNGMVITALAGPVSNIIVSFVCLLILHLLFLVFGYINITNEFTFNVLNYILIFFSYAHSLNLYLAIFNMIPIPPLDGSRLLFLFLPDKYYFGLMRYERIIKIVVLVMLWSGALSLPLSLVANKISDVMTFIIQLIPGL